MATVTGTNLLAGILATQGVTLSPVLQAALAARLQAAIDAGTDSNIQIAVVLGSNPQLLASVPAGQAAAPFLSALVGTTKTDIETDTPAATYELTAGAASADEGTTATFELTTTNVAAGTKVAYTLSGIDAADVVGGLLTGEATVGADGKATISVALAADSKTEGAETLTVTAGGKTASTIVNDTSVEAVYGLTASAASVDEGGSVTFTLALGQPNFTYTFELSGVDAADVVGGALTGTVTTDANGNGTFTVALANDRVSDGVDTLVATLPNTGLSASVTVNDTSIDNIAPVAVDATGATTEAGAVVTGQLVATDAENDAVTFALDAAVEGLTLNADGTYSFDPSLNTAAQALTYKDAALPVVANYTVTDALGATDTGTITITVTPKPLTFTLTADKTSAEEGATTVYTVTASEAVIDPVDVVFTLQPGDGLAVNAGTANTNTADFATGAFNPTTVTIAAGADTATFDVVAVNDATTELQESYSVKAEVAGETLTVSSKVVDATGAGGVGQTFTLTTGADTIPGLIGSANSAGTDGNDTIKGNVSTLSALDDLDGGLGTDTLSIQGVDSAGAAAAVNTTTVASLVVKNIEKVTIAGAAAVTANSTAWTGVTSLDVTQAAGAAVLTAAATTDITVAGAAAAVTTTGGKNVTVTQAMDTGADAIVIDKAAGDVTVTATDSAAAALGIAIGVGAGNAVAGKVTVTSTGPAVAITKDAAATAVAMDTIAVTGGTTVSVTQNANSVSGTAAANVDNAGDVITQGAVTVIGGAATTSVSVVQSDQVAAVAAQAAAGAFQTQVVTFNALAAKNTVTVNGLTFTAAVDMTAEEVAQAFAGLTSDDRQDDGGPTAKGIYTGINTAGFTTGAAVGATVTYTEVVAGTNAAAIVAAAAQGLGTTIPVAPTVAAGVTSVAAAAAITGVMGVANGAVVINDSAAKTITTIEVDGYSAGATLGGGGALDKLATLTLKNSGGGVAALTTTSTGALTLNLTDVDAAVNLGATLTALTINTSGVASTGAVAAAGAKTVTINADAALSGGGTFTAATSFVVNGSATVNLTGATTNAATLTEINASGNSGGVTAVLGAANSVKFTGGAGADNLTLGAAAIATGKNIDLGAGNDTLTLAAGTTAATIVGTVKGGEGTDTLSMGYADAVAVSGDTAFHAEVLEFERLNINGAASNNDATAGDTFTVNLANLQYNYVTVNGTTATQPDILAFTGMAANGTVAFGTSDATGQYTVALADATGGADVLNYVLASTNATNATNAIDGILGTAKTAGTITANLVETFNISSTAVDADGATNVITANGDTVKSIALSGNAGVNLTSAATTLKTVDAGGLTGTGAAGGLVFTANNASMTVTGGAGNDQITVTALADGGTFNGGAGNDTFIVAAAADLITLDGGAGADVFDFNGVSSNKSNYAVISNVNTGDKIDLAGLGAVNAFAATKITLALGATESTQAYLDQAMTTLGLDQAGWFQLGGNTYVVADVGGADSATAFVDGQDFVTMIVGLVDLSTASFNGTVSTLEIA